MKINKEIKAEKKKILKNRVDENTSEVKKTNFNSAAFFKLLRLL